MNKTVSAIIPVFDEEKNIARIIKFLLKNSSINEIICVNDGSTDKSLEILNKFRTKIKIINYKKNHGKGHALAKGVKKAKSEIILFLDADLINLTEKHIDSILLPILKGKKRAVLGYGTPKINHFIASRGLVKSVTGQRAYFRKDLLPHLKKMAKTRFGVEIYLSSIFSKKETKMVPLVKLTHVWKHKKHKPQKALKQYIIMGTEIAQEIGRRELREHPKLRIQLYYRKVFNYIFA